MIHRNKKGKIIITDNTASYMTDEELIEQEKNISFAIHNKKKRLEIIQCEIELRKLKYNRREK